VSCPPPLASCRSLLDEEGLIRSLGHADCFSSLTAEQLFPHDAPPNHEDSHIHREAETGTEPEMYPRHLARADEEHEGDGPSKNESRGQPGDAEEQQHRYEVERQLQGA
jgi:hypothetical protein